MVHKTRSTNPIKVFFTSSSKAIARKPQFYEALIHTIVEQNAVITYDGIHEAIEYLGAGKRNLSVQEWAQIYSNIVKAITASELVIIENSIPSFGTGFATAKALETKKPTLLILRAPGIETFSKGLASGIKHPLLTKVIINTEQEAHNAIKTFIKKQQTTKTNKSVHLRLSDLELAGLKKLSVQTGISVNTLIRKAIAQLIQE